MAKNGSNGTWKTIALMFMAGLGTSGITVAYLGERVASLESRVDEGFKGIDRAMDRFDEHILKGTQ